MLLIKFMIMLLLLAHGLYPISVLVGVLMIELVDFIGTEFLVIPFLSIIEGVVFDPWFLINRITHLYNSIYKL